MSDEFVCLGNLASLKSGVEATIGEKYPTLTEGFQVLKDGYGKGEEFIGIKWLDVNEQGYPTKAELCGVKTLANVFNSTSHLSNYIYLKEVIFSTNFAEVGMNAFCLCSRLEKISDISHVTKFGINCFDRCAKFVLDELPENTTHIGNYAFRGCSSCRFTTIPANVTEIGIATFNDGWKNSSSLTFKGTPSKIDGQAFINNPNIINIYVPWAEGEVANAPWGATNATIHYNYNSEV